MVFIAPSGLLPGDEVLHETQGGNGALHLHTGEDGPRHRWEWGWGCLVGWACQPHPAPPLRPQFDPWHVLRLPRGERGLLLPGLTGWPHPLPHPFPTPVTPAMPFPHPCHPFHALSPPLPPLPRPFPTPVTPARPCLLCSTYSVTSCWWLQ